MRSTVRWSQASGQAPDLPMILRPRHLATPGLDLYCASPNVLTGGSAETESGDRI